MKKNILIILICICLFFLIGIQKKKDDSTLTTVKVAEVTHSIFYTPQYVAIEKGFFEEYGIKIDLSLTQGADAVTSALLSNSVDIGLAGEEATIYTYVQGENDYPMSFAGLTQKDGSFIVSREKIDNFTLNDLKGKHLIAGRLGGMPEMTLKYLLKENNIDYENDLNFDTSIAFQAMEGAFIGGTGDFVTLFEPNASKIEQEGYGYIVAYLGSLSENVPYTSYSARKSYIENNPDVIESFTNAINKSLDYVYKTDSETLANLIQPYFEDTSLDDLTRIIEEYKTYEAWKKNTNITEEEFDYLQDILQNANQLETRVSYKDLVYDKYFK